MLVNFVKVGSYYISKIQYCGKCTEDYVIGGILGQLGPKEPLPRVLTNQKNRYHEY